LEADFAATKDSFFALANDHLFKPESLEDFQFGILEKNVSLPESLAPSFDDDDVTRQASAQQVNPWTIDWEAVPARELQKARTWEQFYNKSHDEKVLYLSDTGPAAFDGALKLVDQGDEGTKKGNKFVFKQEPILKALKDLALGRESTFFSFRGTGVATRPGIGPFSISGLSPDLTQSVISEFAACGNNFRFLNEYVRKSYVATRGCATSLALAEATSVLLAIVSTSLVEGGTSASSLLDLQAVCRPVARLVSTLRELLQSVQKLRNDEDMLSTIHDFAQNLEDTDPHQHRIIVELLGRVSVPWLEAFGSVIGLRESLSCNNTITERLRSFGEETSEQAQGFSLNVAPIPNFIPQKDRTTFSETYHGLQLLRKNEPGHDLVMVDTPALRGDGLQWRFGSEDIDRIQEKARAYEADVMAVLQASKKPGKMQQDDSAMPKLILPANPNSSTFNPFAPPSEEAGFSTIFENQFEQVLVQPQDSFLTAIQQACLSNEAEIHLETNFLPLSISSSLCFTPLLNAQARLTNLACLKMLFGSHELLKHLRVQHQYHMFGSGMFTSRLMTSLFSQDLESTIRKKGHVRIGQLGLRLGSRFVWPPASSELRLALSGILNETYTASLPRDMSTGLQVTAKELPGGLSFAIRDLSEPEIEKCLDANGLEALDFLRLQYKPPGPIGSIITQLSLDKYDRVFKHLLRVHRLLYVTKQLSKTAFEHQRACKHNSDPKDKFEHTLATRFRIESLHFMQALTGYCMDTAIGASFQSFEQTVNAINMKVIDGKPFHNGEGIYQLRVMHEDLLQDILERLLLRKKQGAAMVLLEEILGTILKFAHITGGSEAIKQANDEHDTVKTLYKSFHRKAGTFVAVLRGLSNSPKVTSKSKQGPVHISSAGSGEQHITVAGGFAELLLRLDVHGYYQRT
jgi:hypothetical protein